MSDVAKAELCVTHGSQVHPQAIGSAGDSEVNAQIPWTCLKTKSLFFRNKYYFDIFLVLFKEV